ncbi:MAG: 2-oxo acid dehydrogenase subunit E2, partial [Deltaproteobacteria bacterium]|nr:2-oxo acid dehydrogenase subunit E2 [Deltaproteobacteria bacterium]
LDCKARAGSGPGGRIVQKDVLAALATAGRPGGQQTVPGGRREKMSRIRATIGARMLKSHTEIPVVTHTVKADVTELLAVRERINQGREARFSVNDFILKAVAKALALHKEMLVSFDGGEIVYHDDVHIGMAVALDTGLVVPVIRHADTLGLEALAATARDLAARARAGTLGMDEYAGSTFSVSNLGMYRGESFTPIINQPNAAILGVCEIQDELALRDGAVTVKKVMRHCLTYDHRLMDGSGAATFQASVTELLENPLRILV